MFHGFNTFKPRQFAAFCALVPALIFAGCARTNLAERDVTAARPLTEVEQSCSARPDPVTQTFQIVPQTLSVIKSDERRGVDPYLVAIGFQSTFGRPGSTRVQPIRRDLDRFASGQKAGARLDIPENAHPARAGAVVPMTLGDANEGCLRGTLFGTILIGMEDDATQRRAMQELLTPLTRALSSELKRIVENSSPAELFSGGSIGAKLAEAEAALEESVKLKWWEKVIVGTASVGNPDDNVGSHIVIGLTTDALLLRGFRASGTVPNSSGGRTPLILPPSNADSTVFLVKCNAQDARCEMVFRDAGQQNPTPHDTQTVRLGGGSDPTVIYDVDFRLDRLR